MNTDELGRDLKEAAAKWETPTFDAAELRDWADMRRGQVHRRAIAASLAVLLVGGVAATAVWISPTRQGPPQAAHISGTRAQPTPDQGMAPGAPPPVVITALGGTKQRIGKQRVLVRTVTGIPVTVRARLYFLENRPGRVRDTAIVIVRPGTEPDAAPDATGAYYRTTRVAISSRVNATSPERRILTVTTPRDLPAGNYPVLTVVYTVPLPRTKARNARPVRRKF